MSVKVSRGKPPWREYKLGRVALEMGPLQWSLEIRDWSEAELHHAHQQIVAEVKRRKEAGEWGQGGKP